jgi:hypothetical protein
MKKKLIYFSNQQVKNIQRDSKRKEISFTEMVRRILDQYYEKRNSKGTLNEDPVCGKKDTSR